MSIAQTNSRLTIAVETSEKALPHEYDPTGASVASWSTRSQKIETKSHWAGATLVSRGTRVFTTPEGPTVFGVLLGGVLARQRAPEVCALEAGTAIQLVGGFTNMRFTAEHAWGYEVHLWRAGSCLFGLFFASAGLMGDVPAGLLENVSYRAASGDLAFRARLTMGMFTGPGVHETPSRDVFEFDGRIARGGIRGTLNHSNALAPPGLSPAAETVTLTESPNREVQIRAATFGEWRPQAEAVLRFRGPKW